MAEGIVFPLVTHLITKLGSAVVREMGSIYGAHEELEKLQGTFSAIQAVLLDAEQKKDHSHAVMDWLAKLKDAAYDVDDLFDSFSYHSMRRQVITEGKKAKKVRIFFSELAFRFEMAHKVKKLRERLDRIANEKDKYNFQQITNDQSGRNEAIETYSYVPEEEVIGREEEKEAIVKHLLEINEEQIVSVDAIVGHGGVGKTTLAQSVFNDDRVKDAFGLRLWVCISEPFNCKVIVENIIESANNQRPSVHGMESLQKTLRELIDAKKYLLVMDDLWNEDVGKWADFSRLLMGGAKGSKILITTRSELVAKASQATTSSYFLNDLSESNSWILFKRIALKYCDEPNMIQIGQEIAKKCFGSPLVIRTIGGLLSLKRSEAEWLSFKNNELATIGQREQGITQRLKLTFNHLPSHLKPCFAYCSLFPKDNEFGKDELIQLWVAEGFVEPVCENKCLEDIGNGYFMELIQRSIFQDIRRNEFGDVVRCKMHDLIHDLAQLVGGREYFTADSDTKNANGQIRRVMCDRSARETLSELSISQLKPHKLRTLLSTYGPSLELDESRLEAYVSLRVLDLHRLCLKKLPFSIGTLKHLRCLNLSGNDEIGSLPSSLTKLHNLRTLNISSCPALKELPEDIGSLINLRHLDIFGCRSIKRLPNSVTKLKFLQTLILSCTRLKELPENIGHMLELRILRLQGNEHIEVLSNSVGNLQKLQELNLAGSTSLRELPKDVSTLVNLKHLNLEGCVGLRSLPSSLTKLHNLRALNIGSCLALKELPEDIGSLINLRHLDILGCRFIKRLPNSVTKLKFLQTLILSFTPLKELPENIGDMLDLRLLRLENNGRIKVLPNSVGNLQKLQELNLSYCTSLRELPRDVSNLVNLKHLVLQGCVGLRGMPLGLNKLTARRTLGLYAVGDSMSSGEERLW